MAIKGARPTSVSKMPVKPLRPFFHYYGGKWSAAGYYPAPTFSTVIEPFAGSAGYSLRYWDKDIVLIEKDEKVAAVWDFLIAASREKILSLPLFTDPEQTVNDLGVTEEAAKYLIGFWIVVAVSTPAVRPGGWMRKKLMGTSATWGDTFWSLRMRQRIADQVDSIRHWRVIHNDYTAAPEMAATWFVDAPYEVAGKHYRYGSKSIDYGLLSTWCRTRSGQVIVCEQEGAKWLPFKPLGSFKSTKGKSKSNGTKEVIWLN